MSFIVDNDICSAFLKGERRVISRFQQYAGGLNISAIIEAELYSWAYQTAQSPQRLQAVDGLVKDIIVLPVDKCRRSSRWRRTSSDAGQRSCHCSY